MKKFSGVYPAVVIANVDPANSGRVQVRLPQLSGPGQEGYEAWARIATLMAGKNRGTWFIPDVQDEVLVAFEGGDSRHPYVLGALWSDINSPPETVDIDNNRKVLRSRSGVKITLDDQDGQQNFIVETPGGQRIMLKDGPGSVEITDSNGNSVRLEPGGLTVNASAKVTINASAVEVNSSVVSVNAGMSKFSGAVKCDTLISNSVVSASYTPGAGNVM
jgi:uncharacterized protein involved in type VI secretion and phage assembly